MVETRNGGDIDETTTESMDLQRIQDDMELTKLNYDTLAQSEGATTTKLESMVTKVDSVEKKIETIATDSTSRFEALEKQMSHISAILTRLEDAAIVNQRPGKEIESTSRDQVPIMISEPEIPHTQLGYRGTHRNLENCDKMLRRFEIHVFSGPLPFDWISRAERFFCIGNYNEKEKLHLVSLRLEGPVLQWFNGELISDPFLNWEQFRERMLDRFGGPIDDDTEARLFCLNQEAEQESNSPCMADPEERLVAEIPLKRPDLVEKIISPDVEEVDKAEVEFKNNSLPGMEQPELFLEKVPSFPLVVGKLKEDLHSIAEMSYNWTAVLQPASVDVNFKQSDDGLSSVLMPLYFTTLVSSIEREPMFYGCMNMMEDAGCVKSFQVLTGLLQAYCAQKGITHGRRISSEKKFFKTWQFEFKGRKILHLVMRQSFKVIKNLQFTEFRKSHIAQLSHVRVQSLDAITILTSEQQTLEPKRKCYKSWHFKYKRGQAVMKEQHTQFQGLRIGIEKLRTVGKTMILRESKQKSIWQIHTLWLRVLPALILLLVIDGEFHVKHRWRFKQLHYVSDHGSWGSIEYQSKWRLLHDLRRYMREDPSLIWHRWRYKTGECAPVLHIKDEDNWRWLGFVLLQRGSCRENDFLIMLSSSLGSSLISREGVYMRVHSCLLMVYVMFWWFTLTSWSDPFKKIVREQREKTEPCIHEMVLIHQQKQWKKFYKSWMFKYKGSVREHYREVSTKGGCTVALLLFQRLGGCTVALLLFQRLPSSFDELLVEGISSLVFASPSCWKFEEDVILIALENIWLLSVVSTHQFLTYKLVGKLIFKGESIDRHLIPKAEKGRENQMLTKSNRLIWQARRLTWLNEDWLRRLWLNEKLCCYGGLKWLVRQEKSIRMKSRGRRGSCLNVVVESRYETSLSIVMRSLYRLLSS